MSFLRWQTAMKSLLWVPVGITVNDLFVSVASTKGRSMQPVLNDGVEDNSVRDRVLLDKFSIQMRHRYKRGDVVVLASPSEEGEYLVKRLVALEGDLLEDKHGHRHVIPRGKCWVEGDNSQHSDDSSSFGPIPLALIDSRVMAVIWPPHHIRSVKNSAPAERVISI
ncbi:hypothetical protein ABG067_002572 [Albugo candida]